jgi:hypothetical protein
MSHPVADYLTDLHQSLGVGVPETSGYPALRNLLNSIGETLKPKITAVLLVNDRCFPAARSNCRRGCCIRQILGLVFPTEVFFLQETSKSMAMKIPLFWTLSLSVAS